MFHQINKPKRIGLKGWNLSRSHFVGQHSFPYFKMAWRHSRSSGAIFGESSIRANTIRRDSIWSLWNKDRFVTFHTKYFTDGLLTISPSFHLPAAIRVNFCMFAFVYLKIFTTHLRSTNFNKNNSSMFECAHNYWIINFLLKLVRIFWSMESAPYARLTVMINCEQPTIL